MCLQWTDLTLWGVAFLLMDGGFKTRRDVKKVLLEVCFVFVCVDTMGFFAGREKVGILQSRNSRKPGSIRVIPATY